MKNPGHFWVEINTFMPECAWLGDAETLTYLHATISTRRHRVRVPETPMYLDALLADQPLTGGLEPRLGETHLRILTIVGFPTATTPGILDELNRLAFPYRWSTRAILLDKTDATKLLTRIRRQWFAKRKSIAAILKEVMTNEASVLVDTDAANKAADADLALQELGADYAGQAYVTATITVWDEDPRVAAEKLRLVEKVIQGRDFTAMPETINAVDAWLGSLPGHAYANVRQPPISTLNLAHMIPLSAVWAGPERDEHFAAPPLLFGKTEGSTPFRLSIHVGDVGHTLIVGPTGAGKSVLLALMALQFRRYLRTDSVEPRFRVPERPSKLDRYADKLAAMLRVEGGKSRKHKRTVKQLHADLATLGYEGSYNRVAAFARDWKAAWLREQQTSGRGTFVPLAFVPGEAFQFDWSEDWAIIAGERTKLQVAHVKLSYSRAFTLRAYLLQTHEMLFDAHNHAFRVLGGVPRRGIYDNLWTPPGQGAMLTAGGMECVNLSGLLLERSRSRP